MTEPIVVVDCDPGWATIFSQLQDFITTSLGDLSTAIEHIGSTSVPDAAAKFRNDGEAYTHVRSDFVEEAFAHSIRNPINGAYL